MKTEDALAQLRAQYPWPEQKPEFPDRQYGWGISSEQLLESHLPENALCILEIGSFLGGSARFFADARPQATVICVDPWTDDPDRPFLKHAPELKTWLDKTDGCYQTFLSSNWQYRDRIIPVRGFSPDALRRVFDAGCRPDFIYVDGAHHYEAVLMDLCGCRVLFPDAVLSGDDWQWTGPQEGSRLSRALKRRIRTLADSAFPTQSAVKYFASNYDFSVEFEKNTWVLTTNGPAN